MLASTLTFEFARFCKFPLLCNPEVKMTQNNSWEVIRKVRVNPYTDLKIAGLTTHIESNLEWCTILP